MKNDPTDMRQQKDHVIRLIREAFLDVKRPRASEMLHFPNTGGELWIGSFLNDTEADWSEITPDKIEKECSALTVFSPPAFRYYIPAYMTWILTNYNSSHSNTVDHVLYHLDMSEKSKDSRRMQIWEERFATLSNAQGKAVLAFLEFMSTIPGKQVDSKAARRAIESYWVRFQ